VCILYITRKKKTQKEGSDALLLLLLLLRLLRSSLKRVYMCIHTHTLSLSKVKKLEEKRSTVLAIKKTKKYLYLKTTAFRV
jgi:hypothetical protein